MIQFIFSPPPCPSVRFVRVFFFSSTFAPLPPAFTESRKMIFSFLSGIRMGYIFLWTHCRIAGPLYVCVLWVSRGRVSVHRISFPPYCQAIATDLSSICSVEFNLTVLLCFPSLLSSSHVWLGDGDWEKIKSHHRWHWWCKISHFREKIRLLSFS